MKKSLSLITKRKTKGYILIELLFSIAFISLLLISLVFLLSNSTKTYREIEESYENNLNIDFAMDYMIGEINSADKIKIRNINGISNSNQLGMTLITKLGNEYSHTTYILRDLQIIRLNQKTNSQKNNLNYSHFDGKNVLVGNISEFQTSIYKENKSINIRILDKDDNEKIYIQKLRSVIYE